MEVTDWITLTAVVVALGIGVTSIVQNKRIRKKQYENSVLDNILRWTLDIPKCVAERSISPIIAGAAAFEKGKETKVTQLVDLTNRVNWFHRFEILETESESIKATALIFKNSNLNKTIETAVNNLKAHIAVLKREIETVKIPNKEYQTSRDKLIKSARDLAKLISEIKAKLV